MHSLPSLLSNQSPTSKPSVVKDAEAARPQLNTESANGPEEDALASFQYFFDAESEAEIAVNLSDIAPDDPIESTDQPLDANGVPAKTAEVDAADPPVERVSLPERALDQPVQTEPLPTKQTVSIVDKMGIPPPNNQPGSAAIRLPAQVMQGADLPESDVTNKIAVAVGAPSQESSGTKTIAMERAGAPNHFGWSDQSKTPVNIGQAFEPKKQVVSPVDMERSQTAQPMQGLRSEQSAPQLSNRAQPEQQGEPKTSQNSFVTSAATMHAASVRTTEMARNDRLPSTEKFEAANRAALTSIAPTATKPLHNISWNGGSNGQALDQATALKTLTAEPFAVSSPDFASSPTHQYGAIPARTELPIHIARQLAEVVHHLPNRPVEITLSPEELGRVRLSVTPSEQGILVNVLAERPETLELMRRHIDQLAQEFQSLGYEDIAFSFSSAERDASDDESGKTAENKTPETPFDHDGDVAESTQIHLSAGATTGLDLRL